MDSSFTRFCIKSLKTRDTRPIERRVYLATYNFENVALAYMSHVWQQKTPRDLRERIYGRNDWFYNTEKPSMLTRNNFPNVNLALSVPNTSMCANKRAMILLIAEVYEKETGITLKPQNILFFDDSEENVNAARDVCRAYKVDSRAFDRYFLHDWLCSRVASLSRLSHCQQNCSVGTCMTYGSVCVSMLAARFAEYCLWNNIYVVVFDLDKTLLKIHSFYLGVTEETIESQNRKLDADFADLQLVRALCNAFEAVNESVGIIKEK